MDVQAIVDLIDHARAHEAQSMHLSSLVEKQLNQLHHTIELPEENACETLLKFVAEYIDHVPDFLKALEKASEELNIEEFIYPFLDIIDENFMAPVLQSRSDIDMYELLEKSYFAHRLIEEVNDTWLIKTGSTLIPMNMTWPNLIIHAILGDEFGNELDSIVEQTVQHMMRSKTVFSPEKFKQLINCRDPEEWVNIWSKWNCMSHQLGIDLKFTSAA
ncbi:hypothetical protein EZMO1_0057 [Endozoicomonas montiporae CL-33]|nr:hypothetical protein EZMO1_0057 [Endozoicomonas montiporae CL-33]